MAAFRTVLNKVAPPNTTVRNITPDIAVERYNANRHIIRDAIIDMLTDGVLLGADVGRKQVETILGVAKAPVTVTGVDWDMINVNALGWVTGGGEGFGTGYGDSLDQALAQTSERTLRPMIAEWMQNNLSYNQLVMQLTRTVFSPERAEMIATTEITRSYAEGNRAAWRQSRVIRRMRWQAVGDELTCPQCGPLNQTVVDVNGDFGNGAMPPLHPRCRCWLTAVVRAEDFEQPQPLPVVEQPREDIIISGDMAALQRTNFTQEKIAQLFDIGPSARANVRIKGIDKGGIEINGTWVDIQTGDDIGECIRELYPDQKRAYLSALAFEPQYIGNGMGMKVARSWFDELGAAGYEKAELYAGLSIGRYAWAKEGAVYADATQAQRSTQLFREWAADRGISLADDEYPIFTSALDVATYQHPRGQTLTGKDIKNRDVPADMVLPLGKAFMLDISFNGHGGWNGIIDLVARQNKATKATKNATAKADGEPMVYINGNDDNQSDALFWSDYLVDDDSMIAPLVV